MSGRLGKVTCHGLPDHHLSPAPQPLGRPTCMRLPSPCLKYSTGEVSARSAKHEKYVSALYSRLSRPAGERMSFTREASCGRICDARGNVCVHVRAMRKAGDGSLPYQHCARLSLVSVNWKTSERAVLTLPCRARRAADLFVVQLSPTLLTFISVTQPS